VCDSLCVLRTGVPGGRALFAKNSDRPVTELQVYRSFGGRPAGGSLRTQHIEIPDTGALPVVLSQPTWLWGAEHGVNSHRVAIGNEKVYGTADPYAEVPGLIGMDLVRLGLERGRSASQAVDVVTDLLETYGQGGVADESTGEPYWSSFLVVDPLSGWIVETCGRTWAAKPVETRAAISNRLTLRTDWSRASADVSPGSDFDAWRNPDAPTGHADRRLAASLRFLDAIPGHESSRGTEPKETPSDDAAAAVAHLRDHGTGPWGAPTLNAAGSEDPGPKDPVAEPPPAAYPDGTGVTVCMHVRGMLATTSSMVAGLPEDPDEPMMIWAALGSPCASAYLPIHLRAPAHADVAEYEDPATMPAVLADRSVAAGLARLRERVETVPGFLSQVRRDASAGFDALESGIWRQAEALIEQDPEPAGRADASGRAGAWRQFSESVSQRFREVLDLLERAEPEPA
jgi:secernin